MTQAGSPAPDFRPAAAAALRDAVAAAGLSAHGARLIRLFGTAVYHLPAAGAVARIAPLTSPAHLTRMAASVHVTRWLAASGFPAVEPLPVNQPLTSHGCVITFWKYLPQHGPVPRTADLGYLLRALHQLPPPPAPLPAYQPLTAVGRAIQASRAIDDDDRSWLSGHHDRLLADYARLTFELPAGIIHGDAWRGNLLRDGHRAALADWDTVSTGPRETDLVPTLQASRFGMPPAQRDAFITAYGHDIRTWDGYQVLRATSASCRCSPPSSATAPSAPRPATNCKSGSAPSAQETTRNGRPSDRSRSRRRASGSSVSSPNAAVH
jgi:hypothetical protein